MARSAVIDGWFVTEPDPALVGDRCRACAAVFFPPGRRTVCGNPWCGSSELEAALLSPRGRVWSYTDARYKPPPPYIPESEEYEPFALAAVEVADGLVVLGQVATGYGVADLAVGAEVELVVETLYVDEAGERTIWRWKPSSGKQVQV